MPDHLFTDEDTIMFETIGDLSQIIGGFTWGGIVHAAEPRYYTPYRPRELDLPYVMGRAASTPADTSHNVDRSSR